MSNPKAVKKDSADLIDVVKAGYLHLRTFKAIATVWKKQWFIISHSEKGGRVLTVYSGVARRNVQDRISLEDFISVRVDPNSKKNVFVVLTKKRKVYLKASDEDEMTEWISRLYEVVETDESFHVSVPKQQHLKAGEAVIRFKEDLLMLSCPRTNDVISSFEISKIVVYGNIITSEQIFWFETCNRCCRRGRTTPGIFTFTKMCMVSDKIDQVLEAMKKILEQNYGIFVRVDTSHRLGDTFYPNHNCGVKSMASRSQVSIIAPSISQCILNSERERGSRKSSVNSCTENSHRLDTLKVSPIMPGRRRSRTDSDIIIEQGELKVKPPNTSPCNMKRYAEFRVRKMSEPAIHLAQPDPRRSPRLMTSPRLAPGGLLKHNMAGQTRIIERTSTASAPPLPVRSEAGNPGVDEILRAGSSETAVANAVFAEKCYFKFQEVLGQNGENGGSDAYYVDETAMKGATVTMNVSKAKTAERKISTVTQPKERKISTVTQPKERKISTVNPPNERKISTANQPCDGQRRTSNSSICLQSNGRKISTANAPSDRRSSQVSKQPSAGKISTTKQANGNHSGEGVKLRRPGKSNSASYISQLAVNMK